MMSVPHNKLRQVVISTEFRYKNIELENIIKNFVLVLNQQWKMRLFFSYFAIKYRYRESMFSTIYSNRSQSGQVTSNQRPRVHRHLGPGFFFSILSIKCASTTYMNPFDMFRCEINAFMNYAPFS
jgi:hypothetical protein